MTTPQHPHAEHLAAIAQHLDRTAEATAPGQWAGDPYTCEEGSYTRRMFHSNHCEEVTFSYFITAYRHTTDISVTVKRYGIETRIMVPGDTPAAVIANTAMVALRTTIDTLAQQGVAA